MRKHLHWIPLLGMLILLGLLTNDAVPKTSGAGEDAQALKAGDNAPDFTLPDASGKQETLSDFRGEYVVLYFYPKDFSPGCTQQACDFRDFEKDFRSMHAVILGISKDTSQSHTQFTAKYGLPFLLLADTDGKVIKAYGVWKPNSLLGTLGLGTERTTFVIDPQGKIMRVYPNVRVAKHVQQVLADLQLAQKADGDKKPR